jgi:WD40 repeat protein
VEEREVAADSFCSHTFSEDRVMALLAILALLGLSPGRQPTEKATLKGHVDPLPLHGGVYGVAFSPDSKTLASAGGDGTIKLWDVATAKEVATFRGHADRVFSVAFSPDGRQLASASYDQTVRLWDLATGKVTAALPHGSRVFTVVFHPRGKLLATGAYNGIIRLWALETGKVKATLSGHAGAVYGLAFNSGGTMLASASEDYRVKLWEVSTAKERATLEGRGDIVWSVAFDAHDKVLASGGNYGHIRLWDAWTGEARATLGKAGEPHAYGVAFGRDPWFLALAVGDKVRLVDPATGLNWAVLEGHTDAVQALALSPDGRWLASGSFDNIIKLWALPRHASEDKQQPER